MKVKDLVVKTQTSSKGKEYTALFAILENGEEVIVCFVNKNKLEKQLTNYFFYIILNIEDVPRGTSTQKGRCLCIY